MPMNTEQVGRLQRVIDAIAKEVRDSLVAEAETLDITPEQAWQDSREDREFGRWNQASWARALFAPHTITDRYSVTLDKVKLASNGFVDCKTAFCAAGHAALQNGYVFVGGPEYGSSRALQFVISEQDIKTWEADPGSVPLQEAPTVSSSLLGLEQLGAEQDALYHYGNSLERLVAIAYALSGGRLTLPPEVTEETVTEILGRWAEDVPADAGDEEQEFDSEEMDFYDSVHVVARRFTQGRYNPVPAAV